MKKVLFPIFLAVCLISLVSPAVAAKKRVYGQTAVSASKSVIVSPRLRKDRGALLLNISGLSAAKSVTYELTYIGSEQEQGVFGSISSATSANAASRSLYFGTCSRNVCTPHYGVKNVRLTVVIKTTKGTTITKRYRVKI